MASEPTQLRLDQIKLRVSGLAPTIAPENVDVPAIYGPNGIGPATVGQVLQCTKGNWNYEPFAYTYQWKRDGTTNIGTAVPTYTTVVGDSTHSITCVASATNQAGTTAAPASNAIAVT